MASSQNIKKIQTLKRFHLYQDQIWQIKNKMQYIRQVCQPDRKHCIHAMDEACKWLEWTDIIDPTEQDNMVCGGQLK